MRKKVPIDKIIAVLVILSIGTFVYWACYFKGTSNVVNGTLEVGSGTTVSTTIELYPLVDI